VIGYYVHHVGFGHLQQARCIAAHLADDVTGLSSLAQPDGWPGAWIRLGRDDTARTAREPDARGCASRRAAVTDICAQATCHPTAYCRVALCSSHMNTGRSGLAGIRTGGHGGGPGKRAAGGPVDTGRRRDGGGDDQHLEPFVRPAGGQRTVLPWLPLNLQGRYLPCRGGGSRSRPISTVTRSAPWYLGLPAPNRPDRRDLRRA
jgi:hypothetical protein